MQDYRQHLAEQLDFIHSSCEAFDAGREHEAKRLAAQIRTLVHDTRGSTSLLTHLDVKDKLGFVDRAAPDPPPPPIHAISFGPCVLEMRMGVNAGVRYVPAFTQPDELRLHPPTSFQDWWKRPILHDASGHSFCRSDLVLALANKDGGAHIDATLDAAYEALSRQNSMGFTQGAGQPISNSLVHVAVRQIAEELRLTIQDGIEWNNDRAAVPSPVCPLRYDDQPHMSRNDPCPCGSGRKFKRCFAQRRPRKPMRAPPAESSIGPPIPQSAAAEAPPPGSAVLHLDSLVLLPLDQRGDPLVPWP